MARDSTLKSLKSAISCASAPGKPNSLLKDESPLAAATLANLQALLAVEPPEPLLVHCQALSLQQEMQTPVAKPATRVCQLPNAQPNGTIVRAQAPVAHRRAVNT